MRQLFFVLAIATLSFSCNNSGKKETEQAKDTATTMAGNTEIHGDTDMQRPTPPPLPADSTKTVNLTFTGYDEGDYAHLLFTETGTKNDFDFGHPEDNTLNDISLVIKDDKTAFGYKVNSKMKGTKYVADLVYKMTDTYDDDGQPKKGKEWRIASLKKAE